MGIAKQMGVTQKLGIADEPNAEVEAATEVEEKTVVTEPTAEIAPKTETAEVVEVSEVEVTKSEGGEVVKSEPAAPTLKDLRREVVEDKRFEESTGVLQEVAVKSILNITDPNAVMHAINTLGDVAKETIKYA
jgi:hypothetical protein